MHAPPLPTFADQDVNQGFQALLSWSQAHPRYFPRVDTRQLRLRWDHLIASTECPRAAIHDHILFIPYLSTPGLTLRMLIEELTRNATIQVDVAFAESLERDRVEFTQAVYASGIRLEYIAWLPTTQISPRLLRNTLAQVSVAPLVELLMHANPCGLLHLIGPQTLEGIHLIDPDTGFISCLHLEAREQCIHLRLVGSDMPPSRTSPVLLSSY